MASPTLSSADYHRLTSYDRLRMTPHHLDWANQPRLDKAYPSLDRFPLDRQLSIPKINYMELVERSTGTTNRTDRSLDRHAIATLLHLTHAVTARSMQGSQPFYFRSVASAGALYPFEIYIAVHRVHGLSPGVYHYDLFNFSFNVLRQAPIPIIPPSASSIAATIYISGIFFRSAWKYRHRAYRYVLLDAGHLIENLRLALSALEFSFTMELDFDDDAAGVLLGLDGEREVCLAGIHIAGGQGDGKVGHAAVDLEPLPPDIQTASRVSSKETAYEQIAQAHRAGCERAMSPIVTAAASTQWGASRKHGLPLKMAYIVIHRGMRMFYGSVVPGAISSQLLLAWINGRVFGILWPLAQQRPYPPGGHRR